MPKQLRSKLNISKFASAFNGALSSASLYMEEVHRGLREKILKKPNLSEDDVEWEQDEPESALEESAMEEESQSSIAEEKPEESKVRA